MLAVKEQQAKIDATCRIGGRVDAERVDAAPLIVVLARQVGADPTARESWQVADHFVLERPGPVAASRASAGTYGVVAFQDLNRDLKLQPDEPYPAASTEDARSPARRASGAPTSRCAFPPTGARASTRRSTSRRCRRARSASRSSISLAPGHRDRRDLQPLRPALRRKRSPRTGCGGRSISCSRAIPASTSSAPTTAPRSRCCSCTASTARRRTSRR